MIAIGVLLVTTLLKRNKQMRLLMSSEQLVNVIVISIISGIIGGRLLAALSYPQEFNSIIEMLELYKGGFSILGCVLGIMIVTGTYLYKNNISILRTLDIIALYAPLLQSIARVGCFLAGCCYGSHTNVPWAVYYTNPACYAPLYIWIHPTQLYSSILLLSVFGILCLINKRQLRPGMLTSVYLVLMALQRFSLGFIRADRVTTVIFNLSYDQIIALAIIVGAIGFITATHLKVHERYKRI